MRTFKNPLSQEEEKIYLLKYKEGDPEAKDILIERNLRLVAHIVKKYNQSGRDMEDLISIGTIGLIKAVNTFDSSKGRLATYASKCIENELLMMIRSEKKTSKEISLHEPIGTDKEGNEISLLDIIECDEVDIVDNMEQKKNISRLYELIETILTNREREIILSRYGLNRCEEVTQREIAKKLGISRSYVSRIEKKAIKKLKTSFEKK